MNHHQTEQKLIRVGNWIPLAAGSGARRVEASARLNNYSKLFSITVFARAARHSNQFGRFVSNNDVLHEDLPYYDQLYEYH